MMSRSVCSRMAEAADRVVATAYARGPTLGHGRLVCVDGPAGAGKTTLGRAVRDRAAATGTTRLLHLDDLLDGWDGLPEVATTLRREVLGPLCEGRPGRYRRYDWYAGRFAEEHVVEPVDLLVVEGVGSGDSSYGSWITTLVWVEAPQDVRLERGIERDGEALRAQWLRWMEDESALFLREGTRRRADLIVNGTCPAGTGCGDLGA